MRPAEQILFFSTDFYLVLFVIRWKYRQNNGMDNKQIKADMQKNTFANQHSRRQLFNTGPIFNKHQFKKCSCNLKGNIFWKTWNRILHSTLFAGIITFYIWPKKKKKKHSTDLNTNRYLDFQCEQQHRYVLVATVWSWEILQTHSFGTLWWLRRIALQSCTFNPSWNV